MVAVEETQRKHKIEAKIESNNRDIIRAHKNPQHKIPLWKSIPHIYGTPIILRSIFSTDSCLQSDNGVSTSNKDFIR